jgi:signal peptidase II
MNTCHLYFYTVGLVVLCDQITKALVVLLNPQHVPIIPHFFSLTKVVNTGSIWGIGETYTRFFAYLGIFVSILLVLCFYKGIRVQPVWLGLLTGGILGNTLDRLFRGYVVDFLDFYIDAWHWPCFNIADIAITGTCVWLFVKKRKKASA